MAAITYSSVAANGSSALSLVFAILGIGGTVVALVPAVRAVAERIRARRLWRAGSWVDARVAAAHSRDASLQSVGLGGFFLVVLGLGLFLSTNDAAVQSTFLDWSIMKDSFWDVTKALKVNIFIAVAAEFLSRVVGLLLALVRQMKGPAARPLRFLVVSYIDVFRGLPAIVVIYLICFGLPLTAIPGISQQSTTVYAVLALTLTYAAYQAELFRSGIEAVHPSQRSAALSLGLTPVATLRMVILPQVVRTIAAPMLSLFIGLQKDTALVYVVGIIDAFTQAKIYSANYFNLSSVTVVCLLFVLITIPQTRLVDLMLARRDRRMRG
jgi:polar amino acid transport system permease protein